MVNSKWNVINHETNRRPNCMWSILSWAIFTKVSFGIITVCDDINFLSTYTHLDAILSILCNFFYLSVAVVVYFSLDWLPCCIWFWLWFHKRHNHSKPQIKRNSKDKTQANRDDACDVTGVDWSFSRNNVKSPFVCFEPNRGKLFNLIFFLSSMGSSLSIAILLVWQTKWNKRESKVLYVVNWTDGLIIRECLLHI